MNTIETIYKRKSVRNYTGESITNEELNRECDTFSVK